MSERSDIEWTDASWNPLRGTIGRHYCVKLSPGCDNCYASTMTKRFGGIEYPKAADVVVVNNQIIPSSPSGPVTDRVRLDQTALRLPLTWKEPRRIFICSMTDLFGEWVPDDWLEDIFDVMEQRPDHTYQVLTKRPTRMVEWVRAWHARGLASGPEDWPPHIWLGVSVELDRFSWRAKTLQRVREFAPKATLFVSAEPLLGPLPNLEMSGLSWLIVGGESGSNHRPIDSSWVTDLRDRAASSGIAFHFKQWGGRTPKAGGRLLDGRTWDEFPALRAARPAARGHR